jgi:hypothetical protein
MQAKLITGGGRDLRGLDGLLDGLQERDMLRRSAVCVAAYDGGHREFAKEHMPLFDIPEPVSRGEIADRARRVCKSTAEVDMIALLSTIPLTNGGRLFERDGILLRVNFSDGSVAYAKTRNSRQERTGLRLLELAGLPTCAWEMAGGWIVMEGIAGRSLGEHALMPEEDTQKAFGSPDSLASVAAGILGVVAFDKIFGMVDRNERGLIINEAGRVAPVDHEYLFCYARDHTSGEELPMQGKELLIYAEYLHYLGIVMGIEGNSGVAEEVFRLAAANFGEIRSVLAEYVAERPVVDLTITKVALDGRIIREAERIICMGVEGFVEALRREIEAAIGMMVNPPPWVLHRY